MNEAFGVKYTKWVHSALKLGWWADIHVNSSGLMVLQK